MSGCAGKRSRVSTADFKSRVAAVEFLVGLGKVVLPGRQSVRLSIFTKGKIQQDITSLILDCQRQGLIKLILLDLKPQMHSNIAIAGDFSTNFHQRQVIGKIENSEVKLHHRSNGACQYCRQFHPNAEGYIPFSPAQAIFFKIEHFLYFIFY